MDVDRFRNDDPPQTAASAPVPVQKPPTRLTEPFLKGPIPLSWLAKAGKLPGRALHVGTVIWQRAGVERKQTVSVPSQILAEFGVDRFAKKRALDALAKAGLISVVHHRGRNPVATIVMPHQSLAE